MPPRDRAAGGPAAGGDWRVALRRAGDLAVVGIVATVAAAPLVTAGAAAATASAAVHHWCDHDDLPGAGELWRVFVRALAPGALVTAALVAGTAVLAVNATAIASKVVPGGTAGLIVTGAAAVLLLGLATLAVAEVGANGGRGWLAALAGAVALARSSAAALPAAAASTAIAAALAWLLPPVAPVLPGYALLAAHAIRRRFASAAEPPAGPA